MASQVKDVYWFSSGLGLVGIVQCYDQYEKCFKYYIGQVGGFSEVLDVKLIKDHGAKFDTAAGDELFRVPINPRIEDMLNE